MTDSEVKDGTFFQNLEASSFIGGKTNFNFLRSRARFDGGGMTSLCVRSCVAGLTCHRGLRMMMYQGSVKQRQKATSREMGNFSILSVTGVS